MSDQFVPMSTRRVKLTCDIDSTSCNIAMAQSSRHMCRSYRQRN